MVIVDYPIYRVNRPAEHVVATAVFSGAFDRDDVLRLLDDGDHLGIAPRVGADPALFLFGDVSADLAEPDLFLDYRVCAGEACVVLRGGGWPVERERMGTW